jgi:flagella basal body P-ring formation protein FlgA
MDEAAALIGNISVIKRQLSRGEKMTEQQLEKAKHRAAQIVVILQAAETD